MKIKEGGVMDIQKEREAFEAWLFSTEKFKFRNKNFLFMLDEYGNYEDKPVLEHWETWQAAKAQAVPELTDKMIVAIESEVESQLKASAIDADPFRLDGEKIWYAAIEAQEPAND